MTLTEFRKNYGQNVSMTVCKTAYGYVLNGHEPKTALSTAAIIYARKFMERPLRFYSYRVERELGCVRIYQLQTETEYAQTALRNGSWNYNDRSLCIAALGENYQQQLIRSIEFPDDLVVSIYEHLGRFVSVVALEGCKQPSLVEKFNRIGHIIAVNALGYRYLESLSLVKTSKTDTEFVRIDNYLSTQIKYEKYCNDVGLFSSSHKGERIISYLKREQQELRTNIRVADIRIFGDF